MPPPNHVSAPAELRITLAETPRLQLAALADAAAAVRDPWARHWLVVPGQGRGMWAQQAWAQHHGIASRSQLLAVRALVELAAGGGRQRQPFAVDDLSLRIAGVLGKYADQLPLAIAPTAGAPIDGIQLSWARQLADAIDTALLCRSDPQQRFARAPFLQTLIDDPEVRPGVEEHLGLISDQDFARRVADWMAHWQQRDGLPYLWLALDVGLPEVLNDRLWQLIQQLPTTHVGVFALSPSLQFWADMHTGRWRQTPDADIDPGPILRNFGRRAQDLHQQLSSGVLDHGSGGEEIAAPPSSITCLGRLQASCRNLGVIADDSPLPVNDDSFTVHGARSPLRELEICRDQIIRSLSRDSSLKPHDVLVLLADVDTYGPLVSTAFASHAQHRDRLPFRLNGGQGHAPALLAEGVKLLWDFLCKRSDQQALQALLQHPLLRESFSLTDIPANRLLEWIFEAGFTWGTDAEQRCLEQGPAGDRGHLHGAMKRLAWGAVADPAAQWRVTNGTVALDRASGLQTSTLADLARLAACLVSERRRWTDQGADPAMAATGEVWCDRFEQLITRFFNGGDLIAQQQRSYLVHQLLPPLRQRLSTPTPLLASAFRRLASGLLDELNHQFGSGGHGVQVASLSEWAGTPARMVVVCGLSDERFPRSDERPSWHPLAEGRAWGDANRRDDDRHALLLTLLAAEQRLVLTYECGDEYDDVQKPPATPVSDLLQAIKQTTTDNSADSVHHQHPLNGFSPASITQDAPALRRSSARHDYLIGRHLLSSEPDPSELQTDTLFARALPPPTFHEWSLYDVLRSARQPYRLLISRLGISMPRIPPALEAIEQVSLDSLAAYDLRTRLIDHYQRGGDAAEWYQLMSHGGALGPGRYGREQWQAIVDDCPSRERCQPSGNPVPAQLTVLTQASDSAETPWTIAGPTPHHWQHSPDGLWTISPKRRKAPSSKQQGRALGAEEAIPLLLEMLMLSVTGYTGPFAIRCCGGVDLRWPGIDSSAAARHLHQWCQLMGDAARVPIAWTGEIHELLVKAAKPPPSEQQTVDVLAQRKAEERWQEGSWGGRPAAASDPAARWLFRGLEEPVGWSGPEQVDPALATLRPWSELPSLSMRWALAIDHWQSSEELPAIAEYTA